jgi:cytochrome c oxidase cbb3-type subunit III
MSSNDMSHNAMLHVSLDTGQAQNVPATAIDSSKFDGYPFLTHLAKITVAIHNEALMRVPIAAMLLVSLSAASVRSSPLPQSPQGQAPTPAPAEVAAGKLVFEGHCALCHGMDGGGGRGPSLRRARLTRAVDDAGLKSLIENGIAPEMPPAWFLSAEEIAGLAAYVRTLGNVPPEVLAGDTARGKAIYVRSGCSACHILAGAGFGYGPELTDVGARRGSARLRETLQNPAKTIPEDFLLVEAITNSGQAIRGIRLNEDTFSIQVKDQQGRFHSFRKSELRELKKLRGETPMPAYDSALSASELDDLINFLASQRDKP